MATSSATSATSNELQSQTMLEEGYQSDDSRRAAINKNDPNHALAEKLRGKVIKLPSHMISLFNDPDSGGRCHCVPGS